MAPGFSDEALRVFAGRPALTLLEVTQRVVRGSASSGIADLDLHRIDGGVLVQTPDRGGLDRASSTW